MSGGKVVVNHAHKKNSEFEVAAGARKDERWAAVEMQVLKYLPFPPLRNAGIKVSTFFSPSKCRYYSISNFCPPLVLTRARCNFEMQLLSILIKTTVEYEKRNPIVKQLRNPFGDEGFRMKRYMDDGTEHHAYHADSGQVRVAVESQAPYTRSLRPPHTLGA